MCLKIGLLHSLSEPGFTDFSANSGRPERVRLPVLPLSGHVGVGFLLHAGCALFAVGMRREHLLHGGGFGAFRQFDQLIERVGHAVGVEPVFHAEFEAVFVGFVLLLLRELCIGEGRYDFAQLRFAQPGQSAAFGGSGGIAGSGFTITGSRSFVLAYGDEYVGAIAGGLESSNSITNLNSALQDSESEQSGNYFVSETLGGIDGVSYAGQAEPLSFQEFCDLTAQEGMPDEFRNVTLNFVASQVTVEAVTVEYGAAFDMANAPELPVKGGYTAEWSDFDHDHVVFDQTIEAVYTPLDSVVQSGDTRNGLPILLAEGAFGTAEVTLTPSSESPGAVGTLLECWEITLPEDRSDSHVLHYLAPSDNTVVYLRDADGSWRKVDTTEDGSYLVFTAMTDETTLAAVEKPGIPLPILIGGAVAAVLLVILSILGHKHRKKRLTKKAEQERKRAEETENGWFY